MANQREITELGNPVLRQRAPRVENISDTETQELIDDMILTAAEANGVGIAAPQVSESLRIFIIAGIPELTVSRCPRDRSQSGNQPRDSLGIRRVEKGWEGCLSIPGIRALVPRYKSVRAVYRDRDNNLVEEDFSDFTARVFQHEYDHINGVVFLDRVESPLEIITEKEYMKLVTQSDSEEQE